MRNEGKYFLEKSKREKNRCFIKILTSIEIQRKLNRYSLLPQRNRSYSSILCHQAKVRLRGGRYPRSSRELLTTPGVSLGIPSLPPSPKKDFQMLHHLSPLGYLLSGVDRMNRQSICHSLERPRSRDTPRTFLRCLTRPNKWLFYIGQKMKRA